MIPYGRQNISEEDINAVIEVLRSDFITQGPVVPEFEKSVADYCGAKHAVAVNSATSALHIACLALGVGPGDLVWTSPITFVASANCARYCGADVDFVDIDPRTYNLSVASLAEKLEQAKRDGRIRKVGNCNYSDITVFSFHPVKIITTGEGGMAVTNDLQLVKHMARLRSHGITRYPSEMTCPPDGAWYYQQIELGFNYRMTEIQAALGVSQMRRLDEFVTQRQVIAQRYDDLLKDSPLTLPWQLTDTDSSLHLYVVRIPSGSLNVGRREVFDRMRSDGIGVNLHYIPVYRQPYYERMGLKADDFPNAEQYYAEAITLPIFPGLTPLQQDEIVQRLLKPSGYQTIF